MFINLNFKNLVSSIRNLVNDRWEVELCRGEVVWGGVGDIWERRGFWLVVEDCWLCVGEVVGGG